MSMLKIYTDGACSNNPGPGGWGAIFTGRRKLRTISGHALSTTNNRMELLAVIKAYNYVYKNLSKIKTRDIVLYSDSAYVVNAINNNWLDSWVRNKWRTSKGGYVKNTDLWTEYVIIRRKLHNKGVNIKLVKVKGHSGDTYNEYVDKVAREQVMVARQHLDNLGGE